MARVRLSLRNSGPTDERPRPIPLLSLKTAHKSVKCHRVLVGSSRATIVGNAGIGAHAGSGKHTEFQASKFLTSIINAELGRRRKLGFLTQFGHHEPILSPTGRPRFAFIFELQRAPENLGSRNRRLKVEYRLEVFAGVLNHALLQCQVTQTNQTNAQAFAIKILESKPLRNTPEGNGPTGSGDGELGR